MNGHIKWSITVCGMLLLVFLIFKTVFSAGERESAQDVKIDQNTKCCDQVCNHLLRIEKKVDDINKYIRSK